MLNVNAAVARYIELRDKKAVKKAEFDKELARYDEAMSKIEAIMLQSLNESNMESVRTEAGTFFKQTQTRVGVADWDAVRDFITENNMWHMLDKRVNKTAVLQYKQENDGAIPPGLNYSEEIVVNVRRA